MPDLQNSNKEMNGLIASLLGLQVVDGATTMWSVHNGVATEQNPLCTSIVKTWWNIPIKVIPTLLVCLLMVLVIKKYPRLQKPLTIGLTCLVILMAIIVVNGFTQIGLHYLVRG
jgi:undecaprenyl pyrophosphate phosphatase UppP